MVCIQELWRPLISSQFYYKIKSWIGVKAPSLPSIYVLYLAPIYVEISQCKEQARFHLRYSTSWDSRETWEGKEDNKWWAWN